MQLVDTKLSVDQMFKPVSGLNLGPGLFYNFRKDTPCPSCHPTQQALCPPASPLLLYSFHGLIFNSAVLFKPVWGDRVKHQAEAGLL